MIKKPTNWRALYLALTRTLKATQFQYSDLLKNYYTETFKRGDRDFAIGEFFRVFDMKGVSDSGKEYRVYSIGCCHASREKDLVEVVERLRKYAN